MIDAIARYYDERKNPDSAHLPGVPLGDISQAEWDAFPHWLQESIDASGFYRASKPREKTPERAEKE